MASIVAALALLSACAGTDGSAATLPDLVADTAPSETVPAESEAPTTPAPATPTPTTIAPAPTTAPPTTTPPSTVPPTTAPPTTAPPATAPPTTAPPTTAPPPPNPAACLAGNWVISEAELAGYFDVVARHAGFESIDSTGVMRVSFAGASYWWENDYHLTMTVAGDTYESTLSGVANGVYRAADGRLTGTISSDTRTGTLTKGGAPLVDDVGDLFVGINPARPMDALGFTCDGPTLVLQAGPSSSARHALRLTRL